MKILISCFTIRDIGGISTAVLNLLNGIHDKYDVSLCVLSNEISPNIHIPNDIRIIPGSDIYQDAFGSRNTFRKYGFLRKAKAWYRRFYKMAFGVTAALDLVTRHYMIDEEFDAAVAFYNSAYNTKGVKTVGGDFEFVINSVKAKRKIAWIHNDANKLGFTHDIALKVFESFDGIVNVSYDCKNIFDKIIPEYKDKSFVVYNLYDIDSIHKKAEEWNPYEQDGKLHFVTVARLSDYQKKISRIIETCIRLNKEGYGNFTWTLVGDGVHRGVYENQVKEAQIGHIVKFAGLQPNPYPYMKNADAFVLTSLYEGLPVTIKEAEILACPILTTRFGSADEAVVDGSQGLICANSTEGVYEMIKSIINEPRQLSSFRSYLLDNPVDNKLGLEQFDNIVR